MPELSEYDAWKQLRDDAVEGNLDGALAVLDALPPSGIARALNLLDEEEKGALFALLGPERAAELIEELSDVQAAEIIEQLPADAAAAIIDEVESDHRADILNELDHADATAILQVMDPEEAADAQALLKYPENSAGGVMVTEFVQYAQGLTIADVIADLRKNQEHYADYGVQYVYVCSDHGTLVGVVRMRDLILAPASWPLARVMMPNPIYVLADTSLEDLEDYFDRWGFSSIPVTDHASRMVGVVSRSDLHEALGDLNEKALLRFSGIIGGDELRSMPLKTRASRRLTWLALNLVLSLGGASVILSQEETISQVFALVFFLPIIGNLSGCSGNQAVGVSIREMALGLIESADVWRVWRKEASVGVVNGTVLGCTIGLLAFAFWPDNPFLGLFIGVAFTLNTVVAVSLGGLIPLILRRYKLDPALGAPPISTTLTDMSGFMLVLVLAQLALAFGLIH